MEKITCVKAREVLDSRGNPTVECELCAKALCASAMVPSGASTGTHEALELRDGGKRFHGKGVLKAVENVNKTIALALKGKNADLRDVDAVLLQLDPTPNKSKLGANALLSASMAASRLDAAQHSIPLHLYFAKLAGTKPRVPCPASNLINGGAHAGNELAFQEYLVLPVGAKSFSEAVQIVCEAYGEVKASLAKTYGKSATNVGDEGGFAPPLRDAEAPLEIISAALEEAGWAGKAKLGLDSAATQFYDGKHYALHKKLTGAELADYYLRLGEKYRFAYLEDPFAEEDFDSFALLTKKAKFDVVGDDLLVTNKTRIVEGITRRACNTLLVKPNQVGTVTEAMEAALTARAAGWKFCVSHRSGETEDAFIADFATGLAAEYIKLGAPCRSERTAKYNQLLRLNEAIEGYSGGRKP